MKMRNIGIIISREYLTRVKKKSFLPDVAQAMVLPLRNTLFLLTQMISKMVL